MTMNEPTDEDKCKEGGVPYTVIPENKLRHLVNKVTKSRARNKNSKKSRKINRKR